MAYRVIDIHLGGVDLKFPHHHNERLQANAYYHPEFLDKKLPWSPTFYHTGHLCIKGLKMSKSLKNFTTIKDSLKDVTSNQLRLMFMSHNWRNEMDYSDNTVSEALVLDVTLTNFFRRVVNFPFKRANIKLSKLKEYWVTVVMKNVQTHLENLDFHLLIADITDLIKLVHSDLDTGESNESNVRAISDWISNILSNLGLDYTTSAEASISKDLTPGIMKSVVETRTALRDVLRDPELKSELSKAVKTRIFTVLDHWRDVSLKAAGISLQDTKDSSSWYLI